LSTGVLEKMASKYGIKCSKQVEHLLVAILRLTPIQINDLGVLVASPPRATKNLKALISQEIKAFLFFALVL
jgi:hypothetical protein